MLESSLVNELSYFINTFYCTIIYYYKDLIAQMSGRLPMGVEQNLRTIASTYSNQLTSVLTNFPSDRILRVIEAGAPRLPTATEAAITAYEELTSRLVDLAQRFEGGVRGHASRVLVNFLAAYVAVEQHYQYGESATQLLV